MSDAISELRDALDDAIRRAYCEPLKPVAPEEDAEIVRAMRRAALISDPNQMRHLSGIQAAAWSAVKERIEDAHPPAPG